MSNLLLIDIPVYHKDIPQQYKQLYEMRLKAEALIFQKLLPDISRGKLTYTRGLLLLATKARESGHEVTYLSTVDDDFWSVLRKLAPNFDFIGITSITPTAHILKKICVEVRKNNNDATILVGGPHVTFLPEQTLTDIPEIDVIVRGEADNILPQILSKVALDEIESITYREKDGTPKSNPLAPITHLKTFPKPSYEIMTKPLSQYSHNVLTQRGCKYTCSYCVKHYTPFRYNKINSSIDELVFLDQELPDGSFVYIADGVIASNRKRSIEFARLVAQKVKSLRFVCEIRAEDTDEEVIRELALAGFTQFNLGLEDTSEETLKMLGRTATLEKTLEACRIIRSTVPTAIIGIHWITGFPSLTPSSLSTNLALLKEILKDGLVNLIGNKILVPYPGTDLFNNSQNYGLQIKHHEWEEYDRLSMPVFDLENINAEEIYNHYFLETEKAILEGYLSRLDLTHDELLLSANTNHLYGYTKTNPADNQ